MWAFVRREFHKQNATTTIHQISHEGLFLKTVNKSQEHVGTCGYNQEFRLGLNSTSKL